jgi:hypothetical protein
MKKTYINPEIGNVTMTLESLIAASPEGFNKELDDTNTINPGQMLSRRNAWDEDVEVEEEF